MKKIILTLFTTIWVYASQIIYPLPYTFNDEGFYPERNLLYMKNAYTFSLRNSEDDTIYIKNKSLFPSCQKFITKKEIENSGKCLFGYKKNKRNQKRKFEYFFI